MCAYNLQILKNIKHLSLSFSQTQVAEQAGLQNQGQIGQLEGHYLLCSETGGPGSVLGNDVHPEDVLAAHPHVLWHSQEKMLSRSKRSMTFNDPSYPKQWHLVCIYVTILISHKDLILL